MRFFEWVKDQMASQRQPELTEAEQITEALDRIERELERQMLRFTTALASPTTEDHR